MLVIFVNNIYVDFMTNIAYTIHIGGATMEKINSIGTKIHDLRCNVGLKQNQLAAYLSVDQSYVSKIEKNERDISIDKLEKISDLFGCDVNYFIEDKETFKPMGFKLRANGIENEDLQSIAAIQKIAKNLVFMNNLIGD